ncbi:MAG: hypothetical protein ACREN1_00625, partial [Candidatus Dormibacteria bacterium]
RDGQPVVLTRHGQAAAVVLDWDSYSEMDMLVRETTGGRRGSAGTSGPKSSSRQRRGRCVRRNMSL